MLLAWKLAALTLVCALSLGGAAFAEPGGTSGVSSPVVSRGGLRFEARSAAFRGDRLDGGWSHRGHVSYALTDWLRSNLIVRASQPDEGELEATSIGLENVFELTRSPDWPIQLGVQVEYRAGLNGRDDAIELKLLAERRAGALLARLNLNAERAIGAGASDEWAHEYAARAMWRTGARTSFGVEGFGELDENRHAWGPRAGLDLGDITLSGGYLVGLAEAEADGQVRFSLEVEL